MSTAIVGPQCSQPCVPPPLQSDDGRGAVDSAHPMANAAPIAPRIAKYLVALRTRNLLREYRHECYLERAPIEMQIRAKHLRFCVAVGVGRPSLPNWGGLAKDAHRPVRRASAILLKERKHPRPLGWNLHSFGWNEHLSNRRHHANVAYHRS